MRGYLKLNEEVTQVVLQVISLQFLNNAGIGSVKYFQ